MWISNSPSHSSQKTQVSTFWNVVDVISPVYLRKDSRAPNPSVFSREEMNKVPEKPGLVVLDTKGSCRTGKKG